MNSIGTVFVEWIRHVLFTVRILRKTPAFTATSIVTLALGIAVTSSMFSILYGLLLRPLPFENAGSLTVVYSHYLPQNIDHGPLCLLDYFDLKAGTHTFQNLAAYRVSRFDLTDYGEAEQLSGTYVTGEFFNTLGIRPILGRLFTSDDDSPAGSPLVVVSEGLWRRHFGASVSSIGEVVKLNGHPYTVIGVVPGKSTFPEAAEVWVNIRDIPTSREAYYYYALGRLKTGISLANAQADTNAIAKEIEKNNPKNYLHLSMPLLPLRTSVLGDTGPTLIALSGAALFVMLIAGTNFSGLLFARSSSRAKAIAVRQSLGASRLRIVTELLTDSVVLSVFGGILGLVLGYAGVEYVRTFNPANFPRVQDIRLDWQLAVLTGLFCIAVGLIAGVYPAFQGSNLGLVGLLKEGGSSGASLRQGRLRACLVVSQIALTIVLVICTGLLLRTAWVLEHVDFGFQTDPRYILSMKIAPSAERYSAVSLGLGFYRELLDRVRQIPGVRSAAVTDSLPPNRLADTSNFEIFGEHETNANAYPALPDPVVSEDFFSVLGVRLIKGRVFNSHDDQQSTPVAIITESMARNYFHGDPVGQRMRQGPAVADDRRPFMQIIGVVSDTRYMGSTTDVTSAFYKSYLQEFERRRSIVLNTSIPADSLIRPLIRSIHEIDPNAIVTGIKSMDDAMSDSLAGPKFRARLFSVFAGIAIFMAMVGTYGLLSFSVSRRVREMGLRIAVGASRSDILWMILKDGLRLAALGSAIGIASALAGGSILRHLLFRISPWDPLTIIIVISGVISLSILTGLGPAFRASRTDPVITLHEE